jgi:hypothetical protein
MNSNSTDKSKELLLNIDNNHLKDLPIIYMKRYTNNREFGYITHGNVINDIFIIFDHDTDKTMYIYDTLNDMLNDGWLID